MQSLLESHSRVGKIVRMITAERLREVLLYEPDTGHFLWRIARPKIRVGERAGGVRKKGDRVIEIDGKPYQAGRLAWLFVKGTWPTGHIDHKNRCRDDNRFDNLREATNGQNRANSKTSNKHGLKGVRYCAWMTKKPWQAQITFDKRPRYIGCYATKEEAHEAYCNEAKRLHGEFFNPH